MADPFETMRLGLLSGLILGVLVFIFSMVLLPPVPSGEWSSLIRIGISLFFGFLAFGFIWTFSMAAVVITQ